VVGTHRPRRLHIDISPAVEMEINGRRVRFVGLNLISNRVMVEYDVYPPLQRNTSFGPELLQLVVRDDTCDDAYQTHWEDFPWPTTAPNRVTTRLERRPPSAARQLHIEVHLALTQSSTPLSPPHGLVRPVADFVVALPPDHGVPWGSGADQSLRR
jgi:hypothetical protein